VSTTKVAALIINWNGSKDTLELVESLIQCQSSSVELSIFIVDNASSEEEYFQLRDGIAAQQQKIGLHLCRNSANVGVPAAYNQAILLAGLEFDFYLRLDNDTVVYASGLQRLVTSMCLRRPENVHIAGGNIKFYHDKAIDNCGAVSIDLVRGRTSVYYPTSDEICDGVLGCVMLLSKDLVAKFSPEVFESQLFICTDESELSLRASAIGMKTLYVTTTVGLHKGGRSTQKAPLLATYYSGRNWTLHRLRYSRTFTQRCRILASIAMHVVASIVRGRWVYPAAGVAGLCLAVVWFIDRFISRRQTRE
jgi:GT2 family glycosyltransferase